MPRVVNQSKGTVVAQRVEVAASLWSRLRGLMGRRELSPGQGLYLPSTSSIHTAFMRFPIDIVFVGKEGQVRKVAAVVKPFRMALGGGASGVLELAAGTAAQAEIEPGDRLLFSDDG